MCDVFAIVFASGVAHTLVHLWYQKKTKLHIKAIICMQCVKSEGGGTPED